MMCDRQKETIQTNITALWLCLVHMHVDVKIQERLASQSATQWKITEEVLQVTSTAC